MNPFRMFALLTLLATLALPLSARAQYGGPALEACRSHGEAEMRRQTPNKPVLILDRDQHLNLGRRSERIGSQAIGFHLTGNGAIVVQGVLPIEMSFTCLLADERRAVGFVWTPRLDGQVLTQCRRPGAPPLARCLEDALVQVEMDFTRQSAERFTDARELDGGRKDEPMSGAFIRAGRTWVEYRNLECGRRELMTGGGAFGEQVRQACLVELTRLRMLDMRALPQK